MGDTNGSGYGVWGTAASANGIGVYGLSNSGPGVKGESLVATSAGVVATNSFVTGDGLNIAQGYLQVAGAGNNTSTTAFIWTAAAASLGCASNHCTKIDNPMTNGNASLILSVTQNYTPSAVYNAHPVGIWYDGTNWEIFNEDLATMPTNASFNVLVISP